MPEHKISALDRASLRDISAAIEKALAPTAEAFGLALKMGRCTFSPQNAVFKVEVAVKGDGGLAVTREVQDFRSSAHYFGLAPEDLGRAFSTGGKTFTVSGLAVRSRARPILAKASDGKTYKFPSETVVALLAAQAKGVARG